MKVTDAQLAEFKTHVYQWQKVLGLTDWELYFKTSSKEREYASCYADSENKVAVITLAAGSCDGSKSMSESALHEMMELAFDEMYVVMEKYDIPFKTQNHLAHGIIRRIENAIYPKS